MITVRYAVCSERDGKPVTRGVVETRADADRLLEKLRQNEAASPEQQYWIAELGPECDAWRRLAE
jgi:hypothetical protein